ncbi:MAG: UDP-N-acetylglucosamine--N-acetylmuramyl-(pentapeptide) pyrophosphoryl-undecaprenol N-acetylglucosamine transferase [Planctomycetes bacterium]|nr:UDP-N-acetylglucosamine--N-acetylmuramyl-(pentapeptide) pyrophosphoryl-undecaprenol N-acetylglucosamine transferase [Planctomycetota bacterium]
MTEGREIERSLLERAGCDSVALPRGGNGVRRLARLPQSTLAARRVLREQEIDAVIGTGGGATVPVGLAARLLGLPLCLLEQNAVVGRANRMLAPFAQRLYLGLPSHRASGKAVLTGTPLRGEFGCVERSRAREEFGLDPNTPVVVVTGGSQGAEVLNTFVPPALCALGEPLQVVHLSGEGKDSAVRSLYAPGSDDGVEAIVRPLSLEIPKLLAAADLVVCRGGGCTVAELIATGRPALIVPYPHHRDRQQLHNARLLERVDAAVVVEQSEMSVSVLAARLRELLSDPMALAEMGQRARTVAPQDAAATIVEDLEGVVG